MNPQDKLKLIDVLGIGGFLGIYWRKKYGESQKDIAKALGCHQTMVSKIIKGDREPSAEMLLDAGLARKVDVRYEVIE